MTDEQVNDSGDMSDNADEMIDDEGVVVAEDDVNAITIEMAKAEGSIESSDEAESEEQPSIPELTSIQPVLEAAIMIAGEPVSVSRLLQLFPASKRPDAANIRAELSALAESYQDHGIELVEVASGYRFQARAQYSPWLQRLNEKRPPRYSRALLETISLIAYKQPITRGEIEQVRGVAVSSNIIKILLEREWIKIVGYREVPGKPALFATTKQFLDYFNLKKISDLPELSAIADLDEAEERLEGQLQLQVEPGPIEDAVVDVVGQIENDESQEQDEITSASVLDEPLLSEEAMAHQKQLLANVQASLVQGLKSSVDDESAEQTDENTNENTNENVNKNVNKKVLEEECVEA